MAKPKISVIVTCYNNAKELPKCLGRLMGQSLREIEIICVDDASSDESAKVLRRFAAKDERISPFVNQENAGVSASRNQGLRAAKAEYVMFCDGDDYYEPEMCEKMLRAIEKHGSDVAICRLNVIYQAHKEMKRSDDQYYALKFHGQQKVTEKVIAQTDLAPTNKIFRRKLIQNFGLEFPVGRRFEDAYFCVAYLCASQSAYYLNERLYNYVRHAGSAMSNTWSKKSGEDFAIDHLYIAFLLWEFLEQHELLEKWEKLYWRLFADFEAFALRNSKTAKQRGKVRTEARAFVAEHAESLARADEGTRSAVRYYNLSGIPLLADKLKHKALVLMPSYRLQNDNIRRMQEARLASENFMDERLLK